MRNIIMKKLLSFLFCHVIYRVNYENLETLKGNPKCILCPNHSNIFDPTFIYPKVDDIYIMAKSEIFKNKILARLFKHYGVFPINREKHDTKSILFAMNLFENVDKRRLLMFPEGGILKEQDAGKKVKDGAAFIASQAEVPIIPIYITRNPRIFSKVKVIFGNPIVINKQVAKDKELLKKESQMLLDMIYMLKE